MIKAAVIDNGVVGLANSFLNKASVQYTFISTKTEKLPVLDDYDLLIVPNGTDQIAMYRYRAEVQAFLDQGKTLFCFDGWFTDWLPGNRWLADNSKKTIDIRYQLRTDRYQLFEGIPLQHFIFSNGISGWWACGYIRPAEGADVILEDTWGRAIIVLDQVSTPGTIFATASGPLGDYAYGTTDDEGSLVGLTQLYHQLLTRLVQPKIAAL